MHIFPSDDEVKEAVNLLVNRYGISRQLLNQLFGKEQEELANSVLQHLGERRLETQDVARLLILQKGSALFSGSDEHVVELRSRFLSKLPGNDIRPLFERHIKERGSITEPARMVKPLAEKKWHMGGPWSRDFVKALGFPQIFAGLAERNTTSRIEDIPALTRPRKLEPFQENLKEKMLNVLNRDGRKTRCVVTLPTGGGKTRVAVEAFMDWMQPRFANGEYMIWIAQSEELCEQAIACIKQMWSSREFGDSLRIYRYFGNHDLKDDDLQGGAVIASIQKLHHRINAGDPAIDTVIRNTGAMIIDEAHRAVSDMYNGLFDRAEKICGPDLFPICGLTATPGRSGLSGGSETKRLVNRFEYNLIKPELDKAYSSDPLKYFRDEKYLAKAYHTVYKSGEEYTLTDKELEEMELKKDLPSGFLKRLAHDKKRNQLIIDKLLQIPEKTPTLVYACTVDHAHFLQTILTRKGRRAGVVSSDTPLTIRRGLIKELKDSNLDFLCNFGVLTTGFDAPKVECIAICRPTTSEVLYEQIVGRGMRGLKFEGTETCTVIDFADNILRLGQPLAYARFNEFWTGGDDDGK